MGTPYIELHNQSAWAQYTIRVADRARVETELKKAGVPTAVHYPIPLNRQPAVADNAVRLPNGDHAAAEVLSLPMHGYLDHRTQETIVSTVIAAMHEQLPLSYRRADASGRHEHRVSAITSN